MKTNRSLFRESDLARINEQVDLVELASQYGKVRRVGVSYCLLCLWHKENTGSLYLDPRKNLFLCRSCGAAGNPIQFLMRAEQISFPAAVRALAARCGVTLADSRADTANQQAYDRMVAAEAAWHFGRVRRRYSERESLRWRMAHLALDAREELGDSWELLCCQVRWKRSAERWGRILARLDATERAVLVDRWRRIRILRPELVKAYRAERAEDARVGKVLTTGLALVRGLPPERFDGLLGLLTDAMAASATDRIPESGSANTKLPPQPLQPG